MVRVVSIHLFLAGGFREGNQGIHCSVYYATLDMQHLVNITLTSSCPMSCPLCSLEASPFVALCRSSRSPDPAPPCLSTQPLATHSNTKQYQSYSALSCNTRHRHVVQSSRSSPRRGHRPSPLLLSLSGSQSLAPYHPTRNPGQNRLHGQIARWAVPEEGCVSPGRTRNTT